MKRPIDIQCPLCHAWPGSKCLTIVDANAKLGIEELFPHAERVDAAFVAAGAYVRELIEKARP